LKGIIWLLSAVTFDMLAFMKSIPIQLSVLCLSLCDWAV